MGLQIIWNLEEFNKEIKLVSKFFPDPLYFSIADKEIVQMITDKLKMLSPIFENAGDLKIGISFNYDEMK